MVHLEGGIFENIGYLQLYSTNIWGFLYTK